MTLRIVHIYIRYFCTHICGILGFLELRRLCTQYHDLIRAMLLKSISGKMPRIRRVAGFYRSNHELSFTVCSPCHTDRGFRIVRPKHQIRSCGQGGGAVLNSCIQWSTRAKLCLWKSLRRKTRSEMLLDHRFFSFRFLGGFLSPRAFQ